MSDPTSASIPVSPGGEHQFLAGMRMLTAALDVLAAAPLWSLDDADLDQSLDAMAQESARFESTRLRVVRETDGRDLAGRQDATSTTVFLRERLRLRPAQARGLVDLARALDGPFALTGAAVAAGHITADQASAVTRAVLRLPADVDAATRGDAERFLLEQARVFDPAELTRLGAHLKAQLTPAKKAADDRSEEDPAAERGLWLNDTDEGTQIRGTLDPEAAALLRTALEPLATPAPAAVGVPDARTPARRRADALVGLLGVALNAGQLPEHGGVKPHLTVTVTLSALVGEAGQPPAQTGWGLPLPPSVLGRIACDATVTRVVLSPAGQPLDVGRATRVIPAPIRRAVIARDNCCAFPNCDRPPSWCDVHHIRSWQDGGATALHNLVLLCRRHHETIHHRGWAVRIAPDGLPELIPPPWLDPHQRPRRNPHCRTAAHLLTSTGLAERVAA